MNFKIQAYIIFLFFIFSGIDTRAQEQGLKKYPRVGDYIEDHVFTDLDNTPEKSIRLSDLRGKWVILDFWSRTCGACIASFPKMDTLYRALGAEARLIMAGYYSNSEWGIKHNDYEWTKAIWNQMKSEYNLSFTVAFDPTVNEKYSFRELPMIFIINPEGQIVAKTRSVNLTQMRKLINGEQVFFTRAFSRDERVQYDKNLPLLTSGVFEYGGIDTAFMFRSLLVPFNHDLPSMSPTPLYRKKNNRTIESGRLEASKYSVDMLLRVAHFGVGYLIYGAPLYGKASNQVIHEVQDASVFKVDEATLAGLYAYSLTVPKERSTAENLMKFMQQDLHRYFNFESKVEERMMDIYSLEVVNRELTEKLRTKGEESQYIPNQKIYKGAKFINRPFSEFNGLLLSHSYGNYDLPIVDNTGIEYNIDIDFAAKKPDFNGINEALSRHGLVLKKKKVMLRTIVVTDSR